MPWCPECKTEYREGFTVCSDCGQELVDRLEEDPADGDPAEAEQGEQLGAEDFDVACGGEAGSARWALLMNLDDDREVDIIESLLGSCGIPLLRKYRGLGGYLRILTGMSAFGVDLYVPEGKLEEAREIMNPTVEP